jgi:hypothetical protein
MFSTQAVLSVDHSEPAQRPTGLFFKHLRISPLFKVSDSRKKRLQAQPDGASERLIARILEKDPIYAVKVANVRDRQRRLRNRLSQTAWRAYLELEEAEIGRWTHALDRIAQWALAKRARPRKR